MISHRNLKKGKLAVKIAKIAKNLKLDKFIFDFLMIPFPYMKIIIKKSKMNFKIF